MFVQLLNKALFPLSLALINHNMENNNHWLSSGDKVSSSILNRSIEHQEKINSPSSLMRLSHPQLFGYATKRRNMMKFSTKKTYTRINSNVTGSPPPPPQKKSLINPQIKKQ